MSDIDPILGRKTATDPRRHFRMATGSYTQPGKLAEITDPVERMVTRGLHTTAIDWSIDNGTDGHVILEDLCQLAELPIEYGKNLIALGLCHQADHGCLRCPQPRAGHVYVHDILEHNRTAAQEQALRDKRRNAAAASHAQRWGNRPPLGALEGPKRLPGRPRTRPLPEAPVVHPAEARAAGAKRGGRPKAEPKVYEPIVHELCKEMADIVRANGFSVGTIGPESWLKPCEQLLRIGPPNAEKAAGSGPVTPEQIRKAMHWFNNDAFWYDKVRTMKKLRDRYEELRSLAKNPGRAKRGTVGSVRRAGAPAVINYDGVQDGWAYEAQQRTEAGANG